MHLTPLTISLHKALSLQFLIIQAQLITLISLRHLIKHLAFQLIHEQWSKIFALSMPTKCLLITNNMQLSIINYQPQINNKSTTYLNFELLGFLQDFHNFQFFKEFSQSCKIKWNNGWCWEGMWMIWEFVWVKFARVKGLNVEKNLSVWVEEIGFRKVEERERSWSFIFFRIRGHAAAWRSHAAAWSTFTFLPWGGMPRHEGVMLRHVALGKMYGFWCFLHMPRHE